MWQGKQSSPGGEPDTGLHTQFRKDSLKVMQAKEVNWEGGGFSWLVEGLEESKLKRLSWLYLVHNPKC